jgi:hypothetical protein
VETLGKKVSNSWEEIVDEGLKKSKDEDRKEPSMPFAPVTAPIGYGDESIIHLDKHYTLQVAMQIQVVRVRA